MDVLKEKHESNMCRKHTKLFVPSRMSVIRHTKEFNSKSVLPKQDGKDSGIESLDDDECKDIDRTYDDFSHDSLSIDEIESVRSPIFQPSESILSLEKNPDPDVEKLHSNLNPLKRSFPELKTSSSSGHMMEPYFPADGDTGFSPELKYLIHLYEKADEGLLRNTLLRLIRNISSDEYYKSKSETKNVIDNTFKSRKHSVDFLIDNILVKETPSSKSPKKSFPDVNQVRHQSLAGQPEHLNLSPAATLPTSSSEYNENIEKTFSQSTPLMPFLQAFRSEKVPRSIEAKSTIRCEYCHKQFNHENAWQRHLLTHKGKRTHKCSRCSRSFYDQSSYLRHLKSHNGEKAHKCKNCSMAFSKRSALEVHMRTHTGERPFKCKFCGKGFSISGNLHRHILIHTGHRPYKCGKCPRAFNNPSHLARHISSFHT